MPQYGKDVYICIGYILTILSIWYGYQIDNILSVDLLDVQKVFP